MWAPVKKSNLDKHLKLTTVTIVAIVLSLLLQLAGFIAPGWSYVYYGSEFLTFTGHMGIWFGTYCENGKCEVQKAPSRTDLESDEGRGGFLKYQIETTIALVACIVALMSMCIHRRNRKRNVESELVTWVVIAMLASLISGLLSLMAAGVYGHNYRESHDQSLKKAGFSLYMFPYALFMTGLGGLLVLLVSLGIVVLIDPTVPAVSVPADHVNTENTVTTSGIETEGRTKM